MNGTGRVASWDIKPYVGVGPLCLGMTREQVRSLLGGVLSVHQKGSASYDAYKELDLHLYHDTEDRLEFIEAFGSCPIHYQHAYFLRNDVHNVLNELAQLGLFSQYENQLHVFETGGFALYVSDDIVLAVSVFRKGYYDDPGLEL